MTKIDLLTMLTDSAVRYRKDCAASLVRNKHMNNCNREYGQHFLTQDLIDAILVDFINKIGVEQGVDYALYTRDLLTYKPKWE